MALRRLGRRTCSFGEVKGTVQSVRSLGSHFLLVVEGRHQRLFLTLLKCNSNHQKIKMNTFYHVYCYRIFSTPNLTSYTLFQIGILHFILRLVKVPLFLGITAYRRSTVRDRLGSVIYHFSVIFPTIAGGIIKLKYNSEFRVQQDVLTALRGSLLSCWVRKDITQGHVSI